MKPTKIAFLGLRGIPASYGGYETFVEEIGERLVKLGFDVSVYCRKGSILEGLEIYKGVRLIQIPTIDNKYLHTIVHTFLASLHAMFSDQQVLYYCNVINSIFCLLPRLAGKKTVVNTDGLEWKRRKWGKAGQVAYHVAEWIGTWAASAVITDSREMAKYYQNQFKKKTYTITYGGSGKRIENKELLRTKFGLEPGKYFLYVSRLEPENNAHLFVKAFEEIQTDMPFIVVGDAPYAKAYIRDLQSTSDKRIRFLGYIFGEDYRLLTSHAYVYFHGNEVGGTNPGLVEAMSLGNCVIAIDVPFNREVLGDTGFFFKSDNVQDLCERINQLLQDSDKVEAAKEAAANRAKLNYDWDSVTRQTVGLFEKI